MVKQLVRGLGGLIAAIAVLATLLGMVFLVGMRRKSPGVQRAVRRMNKAFWNPRAMETAGTPGAYAAVVHHVGRRSGATYSTPVVPVTTEDGFVIALPYGTGADWVQNVLAAGRATITVAGATHTVGHPEVVPTERVESCFGESDRRAHRAMRVDECLLLRGLDEVADATTPTAT